MKKINLTKIFDLMLFIAGLVSSIYFLIKNGITTEVLMIFIFSMIIGNKISIDIIEAKLEEFKENGGW